MLEWVLNDWVTDTNETPWGIKQLDELGEIGERAGQSVDLVNQHDVDPVGSNIVQQSLQGRPFQRPP
jgi:hypothetical protein